MSGKAVFWAIECRYAPDGTEFSANEKLVLIMIANRCNKLGRCWPSVKKIQEDTALSERTVRYILKRLHEWKLLLVQARHNRSNIYYMPLPQWDGRTVAGKEEDIPTDDEPLDEPDFEVQQMHPVQKAPSSGASTAPKPKQEPEQEESPPTPQGGGEQAVIPFVKMAEQGPVYPIPSPANPPAKRRGRVRLAPGQEPEGFEEFWALYPRKVGKGHARKAWPTAVERCGGDWTMIRDGLNARLHVLEADHKRGWCKHPTTWLNGECWDDAVPGAEDLDDTPRSLPGG